MNSGEAVPKSLSEVHEYINNKMQKTVKDECFSE